MKSKKVFIFIFILLCLCNVSYAGSEIGISASSESVLVDEKVTFFVKIQNTDFASCTLNILFNENNLEYISGPNNSNFSNGKIIYTWVSDNGKDVQLLDVGQFTFKAKRSGTASIVVTGEFYNEDGEGIDLQNSAKQIVIENDETTVQSESVTDLATENSAFLSTLRISEEGLTPSFKPSVKEYYFVASKDITSLQVTAIAENSNAIVTVTGSDNFVMGKNVITINVKSADGTNSENYYIYVTRTEDVEKANANLETLAIQQASLNPEFDANETNYTAEISNSTSEINLLAIPQKEGASVNIQGDTQMQIGTNYIQIAVTAEDGITTKNYFLEIYRRNEEEEALAIEEKQIQAEKLSALLGENETTAENGSGDDTGEDIDNENTENDKVTTYVMLDIFLIIVVIILVAFVLKKRRNKQ